MAIVRVTRELLEYALDLPEGVSLVTLASPVTVEQVDGIDVFSFHTRGESPDLPAEGNFALAYEETEDGLRLVSAVPLG